MNQELPDIQAVFRKGKETRDQIANICCIIKKQLGQSLARTDKFISSVKPFYRSRNKELKVYGQQSAYGVNT